MKSITELKNLLYNKLVEKKFESFITLTYPIEIYPKEESRVKNHLKGFTEKLRKQSRKGNIIYFYVYELNKKTNDNIHIHILTTLNNEKQLFSLKKTWMSLIGTDQSQSLNFVKVKPEVLDIYCLYVLKLLNKNNNLDRSLLLTKLGSNSKLFGGSLEFQLLLKELRGTLIEYPMTSEEPYKAKSLDEIVGLIKKNYPNNTIAEIEEEITLELKNYDSTYTYLQYQNIEEFLKKGRSKISKGYLQFFNFIKDLSNDIYYEFKHFFEDLFKKKERKTIVTKMLIESIDFKKNVDENYRLLLVVSLDYLLKASIRGVPLHIMSYQLGKLILKTDILLKYGFLEEEKKEEAQKELRRAGTLVINLLKYLLKKNLKIDFKFTDVNTTAEESYNILLHSVDTEELNPINALQNVQSIEFDFDSIVKLKDQRRVTKELISKNIKLTHPMMIKPKDWDSGDLLKLKENGLELYETTLITNGGYLLNDHYFKCGLQKTKNSIHSHKLAISQSCLDTINKIQKVAFKVNTDVMSALTKYKRNLPDFKTNEELKKLGMLKKEKSQLKIELYKEKKSLTECKSDLTSINERILAVSTVLENISAEISKSDVLERILLGFSDLASYNEFYYSYDLDFRMRVYPQQMELSPQGSKLSRSLIHFKEKYEFNIDEFMIYSTRLYLKIYEFSETDLLVIYKAKIEPILLQYIEKEKETFILIFKEANEPYLFLSACIEYKNYKQAKSKNEKYYTGFPIILDCSGSGPQILSLLFLMEDFSSYLNLEPSEKRKDFYISIIEKFLKENDFTSKYIRNNLSSEEYKELLTIFRSCCKSIIMTQIYGVSYLKVFKILNKVLKEKQNQFKKYLIESTDYAAFIVDFINAFWNYLRFLPLFKLRDFFQVIVNNLSKADKALSWTVLSNSRVSVNYQGYKKERFDFKDNILGRTQMNYKLKTGKINFSKIKTSAQANFIHSVDASVNMYILENHNSSIYPIHDAWGVGMGHSLLLQESLKKIYYQLATENIVLKKLIDDFVKLLTETVSKEAGEAFRCYCKETIKIGSYNPDSLLLCKYMAYLG